MLSRVTDNTQSWQAKRAAKLPTPAHAQAHAELIAARLRMKRDVRHTALYVLTRRQVRRALETATRIATGGRE